MYFVWILNQRNVDLTCKPLYNNLCENNTITFVIDISLVPTISIASSTNCVCLMHCVNLEIHVPYIVKLIRHHASVVVRD